MLNMTSWRVVFFTTVADSFPEDVLDQGDLGWRQWFFDQSFFLLAYYLI